MLFPLFPGVLTGGSLFIEPPLKCFALPELSVLPPGHFQSGSYCFPFRPTMQTVPRPPRTPQPSARFHLPATLSTSSWPGSESFPFFLHLLFRGDTTGSPNCHFARSTTPLLSIQFTWLALFFRKCVSQRSLALSRFPCFSNPSFPPFCCCIVTVAPSAAHSPCLFFESPPRLYPSPSSRSLLPFFYFVLRWGRQTTPGLKWWTFPVSSTFFLEFTTPFGFLRPAEFVRPFSQPVMLWFWTLFSFFPSHIFFCLTFLQAEAPSGRALEMVPVASPLPEIDPSYSPASNGPLPQGAPCPSWRLGLYWTLLMSSRLGSCRIFLFFSYLPVRTSLSRIILLPVPGIPPSPGRIESPSPPFPTTFMLSPLFRPPDPRYGLQAPEHPLSCPTFSGKSSLCCLFWFAPPLFR